MSLESNVTSARELFKIYSCVEINTCSFHAGCQFSSANTGLILGLSQPMKDGVTKWRRLSLAGHTPRISHVIDPDIATAFLGQSLWHVEQTWWRTGSWWYYLSLKVVSFITALGKKKSHIIFSLYSFTWAGAQFKWKKVLCFTGPCYYDTRLYWTMVMYT